MNSRFQNIQRLAALTISCVPTILLMISTTSANGNTAETHATPTEIVDSLNSVFGKQVQNRAIHSKGIVLEGRFTPSPAAAGLSKAPHFRQAVPVTLRFSDFAGVPTIPDADPMASPRGLAVKFHLPDGTDTDLVMHSFNGFPTATSDEFNQLFIALGTSGPGVPKPTPADAFLATHPIAKTFLTTQSPPPVSFATINYFGVNSFKFTSAKNQTHFGRYRVEPFAGVKFLTPGEIANSAPGYLAEEIRARVTKEPVRLRLRVQLSGAGDKIDDPSVAWPETREFVDLGVIEVTSVVAESDVVERALIFIPAALTAGIEPADPMILVRSAAYSVSYGRRHQ